jgi:hypothetical protein
MFLSAQSVAIFVKLDSEPGPAKQTVGDGILGET